MPKVLQQKGDFPDAWYSIYKYSVILHHQSKLKSLTENYLSKYNLYRSLSLIFGLAIPYYILLISIIDVESIGIDASSPVRMYIFIVLGIFWYTFHVKFKRYWILCGNEALMSLFVHITEGNE
jgi:hypothetical protein